MPVPTTAAADAPARWFRRRPRLTAPALRLVCFPHAGGAASLYRDWPQHLPSTVEVLAAGYPGRQDRFLEPGIESMPELADRLAEALTPHLGTPMAFFGHSLGADVAYEVAVRLERRYGTGPRHLFVSGAVAPHAADHHAMQELDDAGLLDEVRRLDAPGAALLADPELAALVLPALRSDYTLSSRYRPRRADLTPVRAPVTAFTGDTDPLVPVTAVSSWAGLTTAGYREHVLPGGHFYLEEQRTALLDLITRRLRS